MTVINVLSSLGGVRVSFPVRIPRREQLFFFFPRKAVLASPARSNSHVASQPYASESIRRRVKAASRTPADVSKRMRTLGIKPQVQTALVGTAGVISIG